MSGHWSVHTTQTIRNCSWHFSWTSAVRHSAPLHTRQLDVKTLKTYRASETARGKETVLSLVVLNRRWYVSWIMHSKTTARRGRWLWKWYRPIAAASTSDKSDEDSNAKGMFLVCVWERVRACVCTVGLNGDLLSLQHYSELQDGWFVSGLQ